MFIDLLSRDPERVRLTVKPATRRLGVPSAP
jgi:hypothetical protein